MRQILFAAIILALFIIPVWAQKSICTNKDYNCPTNEYGNAVKADSNDLIFNRKFNYFAKDKTAFLYSESICCRITTGKTAKQAKTSKYEDFDLLTEEFSFLIQDFKMNHQSEVNNLNIKVRYRYENGIIESKYPDFRAVLKDIEDFLNNYPNKVDYWEIVNKKLTLMVLKKYPAIESITSEIQVSPSQKVPYSRSSIVTRKQLGRLKTKK